MKDEEETAKMIFQAFNIHPAARWENGKYVLPNKKKNIYEQKERRTQTKESKNHL